MLLQWNPVCLSDLLGLVCNPRIWRMMSELSQSPGLTSSVSFCWLPVSGTPPPPLGFPVVGRRGWPGGRALWGLGSSGWLSESWRGDHGAVRATENSPSDWPAPPSVCSEAIALDISSVLSLQTFTRTETKIVGSALFRETVVTLLIWPRNPRLDWLQMYSLSDSQNQINSRP